MKPLFFFAAICCSLSLFAQKKKQQEKAPSKQEIEEMLKEMQQSMAEMSEEDKATMDSLGMRMPDMKKMKNMASFAAEHAGREESGQLVPVKNAARIAAIPPSVTEANLAAYLRQLQTKISAQLDQKIVAAGNKVYSYINTNAKNSREAGNMAMALWIKGQPKLALYVFSRVCTDDPTDTDNESNYSSMLIMMGGQHLAIPLLNHLNKKFPKNSTVLNNLGHAWFGLGDLAKAEKYLDSAIAICAFHPQANSTKALIEENRGATPQAVESAKKAIHHFYSSDKERQLERLGYEIQPKDFVWGRPNATDQMGLSKIQWPPFPKTVEECASAKPLWEQFIKDLHETGEELKGKLEQLQPVVQESMQQMLKGNGRGAATLNGGLLAKADKKMRPYIDQLFEMEIKDPVTGAFFLLRDSIDALQRTEAKKEQNLMNSEEYKWGEGLPEPVALCSEINQLRNALVYRANTMLESTGKKYRDRLQHRLTEMVNYQLYTDFPPEKFEMDVLLARMEWLAYMTSVYDLIIFQRPTNICSDKLSAPGTASRKLRKFDDVACQYNDTLNLGIMTFINNCSRMKSSLDLKFVQYTRFDDFERTEGDEYMASTLKISAESGVKRELGPLKIEAKAGASVALEMDRQGIADVVLGVEAKAGAGTNALDTGFEEHGSIAGKDLVDTSLEVGLEGRISLISGGAEIGGTGLLGGIK